MPSAQVLQAFFERMAFHNRQKPPASRALESVYRIACHPPPDLGLRIVDLPASERTADARGWTQIKAVARIL